MTMAASRSSSNTHIKDEGLDEDVDMTSPPRSPIKETPVNSKKFESSSPIFKKPNHLSMRPKDSLEQPVFPTAQNSKTTPNEDHCDKYGFWRGDGITSKKRYFKFRSMAAMIEAHVEELKKRPMRDDTKDSLKSSMEALHIGRV